MHKIEQIHKVAFKNSGLSSLFFLVRSIFLLGFTISLIACSQDHPKADSKIAAALQFSGPIMGTEYSLTLVLDEPLDSEQQLKLSQSVQTTLEQVNQSMSTYLADSELSQINQAPANRVISLSDDLAFVLTAAQRIAQLSDGAFDVTLGPVIRVWGFDRDGRITIPPTQEALDSLRESIGHDKLMLEEQTLTKLHNDTEINLSAIAKGFAVDKVAQQLLSQEYNNFLVDVGGELRVNGHNSMQQPWRIAIETPRIEGGIQTRIELSDSAIATSGNYRNFVTIDGVTYAHTIDSQNLRPKTTTLASVSVVAKSAMQADAWSTALLAAGTEKAIMLAQRNGLDALLIERDIEASTKDAEFRYHRFGNFPKLN